MKMSSEKIINMFEGLFCCVQVTRGRDGASAWITDCLDAMEGNDALVVGLALECKRGMLAFLQRLGSTFNPGTALIAKYHMEFKSLTIEEDAKEELADGKYLDLPIPPGISFTS